jgi:hypothetical protein
LVGVVFATFLLSVKRFAPSPGWVAELDLLAESDWLEAVPVPGQVLGLVMAMESDLEEAPVDSD